MIRGIKELVDLLLLWGFMYVGSFLLMIVAIFYVIKSNPTPPTPIIHEPLFFEIPNEPQQ